MHLVVTISAHGFGHAAQTCAVLNALHVLRPELRFTLVTQVDPAFIAGRLQADYELIERRTDIGLVMRSAIEIDLGASAEAYRNLHADWAGRVSREAGFLASLQPDALLSNVAYLPLAAAHALGIPAVALCCLNWAGIYGHLFGSRPEAPRLLAEMIAAYRQADVFLRTQPALPMPELNHVQDVGVLTRQGNDRRETLRARLGLATGQRLVMIGLGGVATRLPMGDWPANNLHWLVPENWGIRRPDVSTIEATDLSFSDLIASVDVVLGKIGYGLVAECAVTGTPLLAIERPDWPEDGPFSDWLNAHGRCTLLPRSQVEAGDLQAAIEALLARPAPRPARDDAAGIAQACLNYFTHHAGNNNNA